MTKSSIELKRYIIKVENYQMDFIPSDDGLWYRSNEADAVISSFEQQLADAQLRIAVAVKIYELSPLHVNGTFVVHPAHNMLYVLTMPIDDLNQFLLEHPEYKEQS